MSKFNKIKLILHFICLLIAFQNIPTVYGRLDSLLSRLYNKAQVSHRPLILILDDSYLKKRVIRPEHKEVNPLLTSSDEDGHVTEPVLHKLVIEHKKPTKPPKRPLKGKNRFRAWNAIAQRSEIQSPIVKSLLRISNDLRCDAKDDCAHECKTNFVGVKKRKCIITCEVTYECKEEPVSCTSDECDKPNSCQSDSCEVTQGSTKGYSMTSAEKCYKGRC